MVITTDNNIEGFEICQEKFVRKSIDLAIALKGKLKFMSDEMCIDQLLHDGYDLKDARNFVITGCNNPTIPGKSSDLPGGNINMPLLLELALITVVNV